MTPQRPCGQVSIEYNDQLVSLAAGTRLEDKEKRSRPKEAKKTVKNMMFVVFKLIHSIGWWKKVFSVAEKKK